MSKFIQQKPIVLASESKNRSQLLASTGLKFEIDASDIDEQTIKDEHINQSAVEVAEILAKQKALVVSARRPNAYVIAADQMCSSGDMRFDKPLTHERALKQLIQLQGKSHQQICAMAIAFQGGIIWSEQDIATLTMKSLSAESLAAYLEQDKPYYSCGSYHFEQMGLDFYSNMV